MQIINVINLIKKLKQEIDQSINKLIMIFISFEKNLSKISTKIYRHFNLFHAMHDFCKQILLKVDRQKTTKFLFRSCQSKKKRFHLLYIRDLNIRDRKKIDAFTNYDELRCYQKFHFLIENEKG